MPLNCNLCAVWLSFIIHFIYMYINSKVAKKKNPVLSSSCINIKNLLQHILRHHFKAASSEEEEKKTVEKLDLISHDREVTHIRGAQKVF